MIVDDVVGLIPRGYKALKNKLFRRKTTTTTTATPFESPQAVQTFYPGNYQQPIQVLSLEDYNS